MSSIVIAGDSSGQVTLAAPAVSGTTTLTLPATTGTVLNDATVGVCRAWVNYNAITASIKGSFNVSSVTNAGSGQLTVNFTNAISDANYAVVCGGDYGNSTDSVKVTTGGTYSTTAVQVRNVGNTATNTAVNCIAVFR